VQQLCDGAGLSSLAWAAGSRSSRVSTARSALASRSRLAT
jgi:hypothetical protein